MDRTGLHLIGHVYQDVSCMGHKIFERKGERGVHHLEGIQRGKGNPLIITAYVMDTHLTNILKPLHHPNSST